MAVAGGGAGVVLPVGLLIFGMGLAPLAAAVANDLGVLGIGLSLAAAVITAPAGLTLRLAAYALVGTARRGLEGLLAIRAAARRKNHSLRRMFGSQP